MNNFNIIRELYLNIENRNIIKEFLKYINWESKYSFIRSFIRTTSIICYNCYKKSKKLVPFCTYYEKEQVSLCITCYEDHMNKYSETCKFNVDIPNNLSILSKHECEYNKGFIHKHVYYRYETPYKYGKYSVIDLVKQGIGFGWFSYDKYNPPWYYE